jgi:peptidyl-tRNA hydrolase
VTRKLFIVVREDLPYGSPCAQVAHALTEFSIKYPVDFHDWYNVSNTIAVLRVPTMLDLAKLCDRAEFEGCRKAEFHEPDLNNELTAVAFEPSEKSRLFLKHLELLDE